MGIAYDRGEVIDDSAGEKIPVRSSPINAGLTAMEWKRFKLWESMVMMNGLECDRAL